MAKEIDTMLWCHRCNAGFDCHKHPHCRCPFCGRTCRRRGEPTPLDYFVNVLVVLFAVLAVVSIGMMIL